MSDHPRIDPDSVRNGRADARLIDSGVSVWVVVDCWLLNRMDAALVAGDYDIPVSDVEAALAYYHEHQAVIDARITLHHDFFEARRA